ncbi:MAG: ATP-binding protein [Oscillospiraceae bacterium]|nr:ATP-binding protein [Oscillospiraceae bacterium]
MNKRIFRAIFFAALISMTVLFLMVSDVMSRYFVSSYKKQIINDALNISEFINSSSSKTIADYSESDTNRITLIAADGTVEFDNQADISRMENHGDREEVIQALEEGTGSSERFSSTIAEKTYNYAVRLESGEILRVSGTRYTMFSILLGMLQPILIILIAVVILSAFLSSKLSKSIVKPINLIDIENPDENVVYEELTPLLDKIASQNRQIKLQIEELKRKQQEFITITENMSEGLLIIDSKTNVLTYNESALKIFDSAQIPDKQSVFVLNRSSEFRNNVLDALKGRSSADFMTLRERTYQVFINSVRAVDSISSQDADNTIGAVIIILDVTEKEEQERMRREFTANVSHELKTPLTSISGCAELLKNGMVRQQDIKHFSENIYLEAQRMIKLIGDIIRLSQLDENLVPLEKEQIDLYTNAKNAVLRLSELARSNKVSVELTGEHTRISAVPQIIDEMIFNLVENAIKYNRPGGNVTVSVFTTAEGKAKLSVEDNGIGIPDADRDRVFERFYRVDKSHSKEIGGTGLGLSIVKHAARYHNAVIDIKSLLSKGTTIEITF